MTAQSISWRDLIALKPAGLAACKAAAVIALADVAISLVLSATLPASAYVSWFLYDDYDHVISRFEQGQMVVMPDANAGWINRPHVSTSRWKTDFRGARLGGNDTQNLAAPTRVLMLGSSMINGGMHVSNDQTISSFIESESIEVLNFGSMLYSIDQSFIDYNTRLAGYDPDVIVVGLNDDAYAVTNMFIPFRLPKEKNMPFFKPRFMLRDAELVRIPNPTAPPDRGQNWADLLDQLSENDASFWKFESYVRLGVMPISSLIRRAYKPVRRHFLGINDYKEGLALQSRLIREFEQAASERGAHVIFLAFVDSVETPRALHRLILPDYNEMYLSMLREATSNVIFADRVLFETGRPAADFYHSDGLHLTPAANEILAKEILRHIQALGPDPVYAKHQTGQQRHSP